MKEGYISSIRDFITVNGRKQSKMDINSLGNLHLIGFAPSKLINGKRLYRNLVNFIQENDILEKNIDDEPYIFEKIVLYVNQQKWKREKLVNIREFKDDIHKYDQSERAITKRSNISYNTVEYSIIEKKAGNTKQTNNDIELTYLLNQFEHWLNDYLKIFSDSFNKKNDLIQLLKLIISK